ncbi:GAF:ATP-binding region, ATPase-like [Actinokineospora spheciospongiae]|uniref:GAF:ATP-binding region, ATPase-like n=2 Tax=Actinokineospora spheciospongiae TaxID=909613 RepID=W7IUW4_9PSEU|nr:GAF:ATP-binding region, ATPase-like [Actinokineospora spheciospongiae]
MGDMGGPGAEPGATVNHDAADNDPVPHDPRRRPAVDPPADRTEPQAPHLARDALFRGLVDRAVAAEMSHERMRHLLGAVLSVASDLSLPDVLRRVVAVGCELVGARYGALGVLGPDGELTELLHSGVPDDVRAAIGALPTGRGVLGVVGGQTGPLRIDELRDHPAAAGFPPGHPEMGSFLGVPIRLREQVYGNLYLADKADGRAFTDEDEDVVVALAAAAGMAVTNARHYELSQRRERWLVATTEVTAVLRTGGGGEDEGLALLVRRAREIAAAAVAIVAVPDGPGHMVLRAVDGRLREELTGTRMVTVDSLTGDVFSTGRPRSVTEVAEATLSRSAQTFRSLPPEISELGPAVLVPLTGGRTPAGVLIVARDRGAAPFDESDLGMVLDYGTHAALAMGFAEAQRDKQRLALFEERDRIARDLHDLVIQRLFALGLGLQGLRRDPAAANTPEQITGFIAEIDQTIRELRRSIFSLQQPANGPYSLRSDILRVISDATVSLGYEPTVRLEGPLDSVVPADIALDLIATLRESLSNVVRHADAAAVQVTVAVDRRATRLELLVHDDGRGVPEGLAHRSGLANMAQRARRWSGRCVVGPADVGGTRVDWSVPLGWTSTAAARGAEEHA